MKHDLYQIITPPPIVGYYVMGDVYHFSLTKKPNWFNRLMVRCVLGWKWKEA